MSHTSHSIHHRFSPRPEPTLDDFFDEKHVEALVQMLKLSEEERRGWLRHALPWAAKRYIRVKERKALSSLPQRRRQLEKNIGTSAQTPYITFQSC